MGFMKELAFRHDITREDVLDLIAICKYSGIYLYLDKRGHLISATENRPIPEHIEQAIELMKDRLTTHLESFSYLDS